MANPLAATDSLQNVLTDARETAREQLAAAWQIEVERFQSGWRGHLEAVFEERFAELNACVEEQLRSLIESRVAGVRARSQREVSSKLNHAVRRIRAFENEDAWSRALVEATAGFCDRAALFIVNGTALRLQAVRGIASGSKIDNTPLESAPAFRGAVESRDTIVALRTRGELSGPITEALGETPDRRAYLFPIPGKERVAAVLYADSEDPDSELDSSALELLATCASAVLEGQSAAPAQPSTGSWSTLSKSEQELHLRAQRFARIEVAQMRLYKSPSVKDGRSRRDLYGPLKEEIDCAREAFRRDFLLASATMVDYLHLELLRTLANDNAELLGPEYPGPMA